MTETVTIYRMSWRGVGSQYAAMFEMHHGRAWDQLDPEQWESLPWKEPSVRVDQDPWSQYNTLKRWQQTHEQPIKDLKLEKAELSIPVGDEWVEVQR